MKNIILLLIMVALINCKNRNKQLIEEPTQAVEDTIPKAISEANRLWLYAINLDSDVLKNSYSENAVKVTKSGEIFNGQDKIMAYHQEHNIDIDSTLFWETKTVLAGKKENFEYQINTFVSMNASLMKEVVIWDLNSDTPKRTFEFIKEANFTKNLFPAIDNARKQWIKLCNQHNAKNLIEEMYTENTVYYNHKPVVIGHKDLEKEYQYMNRDDYELMLTPIIVEMVQDDLVFEIGQCSGTYGGKYILIWQQGADGKWRVLVDSNI